MEKKDKLILEALRELLMPSDATEDVKLNNPTKTRIANRITDLLNPKKSEFPEIKETLKEKPKWVEKKEKPKKKITL